MKKSLVCVSLLGLLAGCATERARQVEGVSLPAVSAPPAAAAAQPPAPPDLRLDGKIVRPLRYGIELTLLPEQDDFPGVAKIDVEIAHATEWIWLNSTELEIKSARVTAAGSTQDARVTQPNEDFILLALSRPVEPGKATIRIEYGGKMLTKDTKGLFRVKEAGEWYAYSQFEAMDARRAFPCMDQPNFKVPWQLTLKVPKAQVAVSNTPIDSETTDSSGMKVVRFRETQPLPSYLVALAVGPFDIVEAGKTKMKRAPIRIFVPKGRARDAALSASITPQILAELESYFEIPYPYEKLDNVAVPHTVGFGAMENAGMVTYSQGLLLARPEQETTAQRRRYASVCAHELSHQWFGDLVTTDWWNDIWLNEGFATWVTTNVLERWRPGWNFGVDRVHGQSGAINSDSLVTARKVRQAIESVHDVRNAFDDITYRKGAALLTMVEHWVGEETFRKGIRHYLNKHAWGNATADNFIRAVGEVAGRDLAPVLSSFLDQPGVPLISADVSCTQGRSPAVTLKQERYLPTGSAGSPQQVWKVPVCFRYGSAGKTQRQCEVLSKAEETFPISSETCPRFFLANDRATGYYRVRHSPESLRAVLTRSELKLSAPERVATIQDIFSLVRNNMLPAGNVLAQLPRLFSDRNLDAAASTVGFVSDLGDKVITPDIEPQYQAYIRKYYGPLAHRLGWLPKPSDSETARVERATLVSLVAGRGADPQLLAEARRLANRWIRDSSSMSEETVASILAVSARHGDRTLFERIHQRARTEKDRRVRLHLIRTLSQFEDPRLLRAALEIALTDELDPVEAMSLLPISSRPQVAEVVYQFLRENLELLVRKFPTDSAARFPSLVTSLCDESRKSELESFFQEKTAHFKGGPRNLAQAMERLSLCSANRAAQRPSVAEFFHQQRPGAVGAAR